MPWTPDDAPRHTKAASTAGLRQLWATVANNALQRTGDDGQAIREANAAVAKARSKGIAHKWLSVALALSLALLPFPVRAQGHPAPVNGGGQGGTPSPLPPCTYSNGAWTCAGSAGGDVTASTVKPPYATTPLTLGVLFGNAVDVRAKGAKCDGATDDGAAIQAALDSGYPAIIPAGMTCATGSTLTVPAGGTLAFGSGATLKWIGASGDTVVQTPRASASFLGIVGLGLGGTIDGGGTAGVGIDIQSGLGDTVERLQIKNLESSATAIRLGAAYGSGPSGNLAFLNMRDIAVPGPVAECVVVTGTGGASPTLVVTLNNFYNVNCDDITVRGWDFVQDADSNNVFGGYIQVDANNGVGIIFGSGSSTINVGVYENAFYNTPVDTFPNVCGGACTGRTGAIFNNSPWNSLHDYVQGPEAENGAYVFNDYPLPETVDWINNSTGERRVDDGFGYELNNALTGVVCTGLGTGGSCAANTIAGKSYSSASHGVIALTAGTSASTSGNVTLQFPFASSAAQCQFGYQSGTGIWSPGALRWTGIDTTHVEATWNNGSGLTNGDIYYLDYDCRFYP